MVSFPNMESFRTGSDLQRTASILIKQHHSHPNLCTSSSMINEDCSDEISKSAERLYDASTWRMYNRIVTSRKRRSHPTPAARRMTSADALSERGSINRTMDIIDSFPVPPYTGKVPKRADRMEKRSLFIQPDPANVREEDIFTLDL